MGLVGSFLSMSDFCWEGGLTPSPPTPKIINLQQLANIDIQTNSQLSCYFYIRITQVLKEIEIFKNDLKFKYLKEFDLILIFADLNMRKHF